MATPSPPSGPSASAFLELARAGDGLKRLVALQQLAAALSGPTLAKEDRATLARLLDDALSDAEAHAEALVRFFERNANSVNELVAAGQADGKRLTSRPTDDFAAAAAATARSFLGLAAAEHDRLRGDGNGGERPVTVSDDCVCGAYDELIFESDVKCIEGDELACAEGAVWAHLAKLDGCP
jgi:hypothetical protein